MNILITGGSGFIGSNYINYHMKKYPLHNIYNIDCLNYCSNINNIEKKFRESNKYIFIKGNILSKDLIIFILNKYKIDIIIHFAAQSHVCNSFENSLQYSKDNYMGTHTLLECSRIYGKLKKFIHISTDEVYGESEINEEGKLENTQRCPTNPYSASKAAAEMMVNAYKYSYKLPIIITRCNNIYGINQYPEKLIPKFIKLLKEGKKCTIHGDGSNLRSFLYIEDFCTALDKILEKGKLGEIYNIGINKEYSVLEIGKKLIKLIKNSENYSVNLKYVKDRKYNDKRYFINYEKLTKLGWKSKINIDEGLKKLI